MSAMRPFISIIVPVFNELQTIEGVLARLDRFLSSSEGAELIIVDDGSTDGTSAILANAVYPPHFTLLKHQWNQGKGAAFRTGLARATGLLTVVHDADLEYDPSDLPGLIEPLLQHTCRAVYGTRYSKMRPSVPWSEFRLAVVAMNCLVWILYGQRLEDVATCYKVLPTELYRNLDLRSRRFELCAEVTAKLCRSGICIKEVPINYRPRSRQEGKKIGWRDAFSFAWTLILWRFRGFQPILGRSESIILDRDRAALPAIQR